MHSFIDYVDIYTQQQQLVVGLPWQPVSCLSLTVRLDFIDVGLFERLHHATYVGRIKYKKGTGWNCLFKLWVVTGLSGFEKLQLFHFSQEEIWEASESFMRPSQVWVVELAQNVGKGVSFRIKMILIVEKFWKIVVKQVINSQDLNETGWNQGIYRCG